MPEGDVTGANLPGMKGGVANFMNVRLPLEKHSRLVHGALENFPDIGGNGQFGDVINSNYYPAAKASAKFLAGILDLTDVNGGKTKDLTHLLTDPRFIG